MTPRQREFCRHYLAGMPAARAAKAAGYAESTAEKNAADILRTPSIAAWLHRHRTEAVLVTQDHLRNVRDRLIRIIDTSEDDRAATLAGATLMRLRRMHPSLAAEASVTHPEPAQAPINQDPPPQNSEITETDHLPTGEPAAGLRLAPLKAEVAKPRTPISITLKTLRKSPPRKKSCLKRQVSRPKKISPPTGSNLERSDERLQGDGSL